MGVPRHDGDTGSPQAGKRLLAAAQHDHLMYLGSRFEGTVHRPDAAIVRVDQDVVEDQRYCHTLISKQAREG
jgi:hypothetical protein